MKKKLIIAAGVVLIITCGIFIYLKSRKLSDFSAVIREKLQSAVIVGSDSLYRLEFDTLEADVLKSKLIMLNVRLIPDSLVVAKLDSDGRRPADVYKVFLKTLIIDGINVPDFISDKRINLDVLYISEPQLEICHKKPVLINVAKDTAGLQTVYQRISQEVNRLAVKKIIVQDMNVIHHNYLKNDEDKITKFNKVNIVFDDVLVDSLTQFDTTRFLYAKDASISLGKMKLRTADSLYFINMDTISINALKKDVRIDGFAVVPRGSKEEFTRKLSFIKERYENNFDHIIFKKIDWWGIVSDESFEAEEAEIEHGKLTVYTDRNLPPYPKSKVGKYPHQLVMKSPVPLNIRKIKITDFDLTYEELNPKSGKKGSLTFNNINGIITNVTNDSEKIARDPLMKINASGQLMQSGSIKAEFVFNLAKADAGVFSVDVHLGTMDATKLNPVTQPLGLFKIDKANIKELTAHVDGSNYKGTGSIKFLYDDLKIVILQPDNSSGQLKEKDLISFIANAFVLKSSNPKAGETVREETAAYTRDVHKSFFNLIWKTILIGIMKTIGYEQGAKKVK